MSVEMINDHKVIMPTTGSGGQLIGVGVHEVSRVIGRASLVVNDLCSSGSYINRWAKYKPVRYRYLNTVTGQWDGTNKRWKKSVEMSAAERTKGEWWRGDAGNCGIDVSVFNDLMQMVDEWLGKDNMDWRTFWSYASPRGSRTPDEPYRLTDFALYCHTHINGEDFDKPLAGWTMPSQITKYLQAGQYVLDAQSSVTKRADNDYLLSLADIYIDPAHGINLANMYFGIAIDNGLTGGNRRTAFQTCHYTFNDTIPASNPYDGSYGTNYRCTPILSVKSFQSVGTYKVLPFLCGIKIEDNGLDTSSNLVVSAYRTQGSEYVKNIKCIPLPFFGKEVVVEEMSATIKMTTTITSATGYAGSCSVTVKYTAIPLVPGALNAGWASMPILIQVFYDGQSPAGFTSDSYSVPESSDSGWTDSGGNKELTAVYSSLGGATSGHNMIQINILSYNGYITTTGATKNT